MNSPIVRNEINRLDDHQFDVSGKGINVARVLKQLNCDVTHFTHLGKQSTLFLKMAAEDEIPVIWENSSSDIRYCYTLLDKQDKGVAEGVTEIIEESSPVSLGMTELMIDRYKSILRDYTHLVISGSKAAGYDESVYPEMVHIAKDYGLKILLDIRGADLLSSIQYGPHYLKINLMEFVFTFFPERQIVDKTEGLSATYMAKVRDKMIELKEDSGITTILTDESNPILYTDGNKIRKISPAKVNIVNTTGCGDAFAAGAIDAIAKKKSLKEIVLAGMDCSFKNAELKGPGEIK